MLVQPEEEEVRVDESAWIPPQEENVYEVPAQATADTSGAVCETTDSIRTLQEQVISNDVFQLSSQHTNPPLIVPFACDKPLCGYASKSKYVPYLPQSLPHLVRVPQTFSAQAQPREEEVKVDESTWIPPRAERAVLTYEVPVQATADTTGAVCETANYN